jgi:TfoX/Sxy family transcriptional regulator of competence genes
VDDTKGLDGGADAARDRLSSLLPSGPDIEVRTMFGTLAALVDGHVFAVVVGDRLGVKADPEGLESLAALPGTEQPTMGGRTLRAYRTLPASMPVAQQRAWLERARDHVRRRNA